MPTAAIDDLSFVEDEQTQPPDDFGFVPDPSEQIPSTEKSVALGKTISTEQQAAQQYAQNTDLTRALSQDLPADFGRTMQEAGQFVGKQARSAALEYTGQLEEAQEEAQSKPGEGPFEEGAATLPTPLRALSSGVTGLIETTPKLAAVAGAQAIGVPAPIAAGAVFGSTPQGFDPKQAAIAAALPFVGKLSGAVAEFAAAKTGISSATALTAINKLGGAGGAAGLLSTDQLAEISKLPPEKRQQAFIDAAGNVAAMSLLGMTANESPEALSRRAGFQTQEENIAKSREGSIEVPSEVTPMTPSETPGRAALPRGLNATATEEASPTTGEPNASQNETPTTVHGAVRPQPVESTGEVPAAQGGAGIQPPVPNAQAQAGEVPLKEGSTGNLPVPAGNLPAGLSPLAHRLESSPVPRGFTRDALQYGAGLDPAKPEHFEELQRLEKKYQQQLKDIPKDMDHLDEMSQIAARKQWTTEAIQAATGLDERDIGRELVGANYKAPFPKTEVTPREEPAMVEMFDPKAVPIAETPVAQINLSAEVPNFKTSADPDTGVVPGQELEGSYERLGTAPIIVWRRKNGALEVISGRHRLDLAKRSSEKTIPTQIVDESKGFTVDMAKTFDAEANIRDGQGDVEDYAHYFKNSPQLTREAAETRGLLSRAKGKAGFDLGKNASDDLYSLWQSGKIGETEALAITRAAPGNASAQRIGIKFATQGGKSPEFLSNVVKAALVESGGSSRALDLFGNDDGAMQAMQNRAARAEAIQKEIRSQIASVSGAAKNPQAAKKLGVDVSDPKAVQAKVEQLRGELQRWENWPVNPDLAQQTLPEKPTPAPPAKPGGELFGASETPFNLTGESAKASAQKPPQATTGFGNQTASQQEMFAIQKIAAEKDPLLSANAAQKVAGGDAAKAAAQLRRQLAVVDADPVTKKQFVKAQRNRLQQVVALLDQRAESGAKGPGIIGMGGATPSEFSGGTIEDVISGTLAPPRIPAQPEVTPGMATAIDNLRQAARGSWEAAHGTLGQFLNQTFPRTTLKDPRLGELGARWISSHIAAQPMAEVFAADVLGNSSVDPVKLGAALTEDNLRSIKKTFADKGDDAAKNVKSFVGQTGFPFATEKDYQTFLNNPATKEVLERHKSLWQSVVEPQYKEAMSLDPEMELPSRGLQTGARINLRAVREGEDLSDTVRTVPRGNLLATLRRKSPFGVQAKGTGEGYALNYYDIMANTFGRQMEIANKNAFENALVKAGQAVIAKPGEEVMIQDREAVPFPLKRQRVIIPGTGGVSQNQSIYINAPLAKEYRIASNVNEQELNRLGRVLSPVLNRAALAGLTDATTHAVNLFSSLMTLPGGSGPLLQDIVLSALPGRPDAVVSIGRALVKGFADTRAQRATLAQIGAMKPGRNEKVTMDPTTWFHAGSNVIRFLDTSVRLALDDTYKRLAQQGLVENSETARREFINQVGQYNLRAQNPLLRFFRQTGLGPFSTAGTTFNNLGVRSALGPLVGPGVRASSTATGIALRANMLAKIVGLISTIALLNYLLTHKKGGGVMGRPGVRLGAIDTGRDDKEGRPLQLDILSMTGPGRGARVLGARGFIEAKMHGLKTATAADTAARDIINSAIAPFTGPAIRFASVAATGYPAAKDVGRVSTVVPPGENQTVANFKQALLDANPVVSGINKAAQPGSTGLTEELKTQLPRLVPQPGKPPQMMKDYPAIVRRAQANAYIEDVIGKARKMEVKQRTKFLKDSVMRLENPQDRAKAIREFKERKL